MCLAVDVESLDNNCINIHITAIYCQTSEIKRTCSVRYGCRQDNDVGKDDPKDGCRCRIQLPDGGPSRHRDAIAWSRALGAIVNGLGNEDRSVIGPLRAEVGDAESGEAANGRGEAPGPECWSLS